CHHWTEIAIEQRFPKLLIEEAITQKIQIGRRDTKSTPCGNSFIDPLHDVGHVDGIDRHTEDAIDVPLKIVGGHGAYICSRQSVETLRRGHLGRAAAHFESPTTYFEPNGPRPPPTQQMKPSLCSCGVGPTLPCLPVQCQTAQSPEEVGFG